MAFDEELERLYLMGFLPDLGISEEPQHGVRLEALRHTLAQGIGENYPVLSLNREITAFIEETLASRGLGAEVINIGSTNPERLTHTEESLSIAPFRPFPPDFSLRALLEVSPNGLDLMALVESILPNSRIKQHGPYSLTALMDWNGYYVSIHFLPKLEKTIHYIDYAPTLNEEEKLEARLLKLLLQRNGVYGGANRAIAGNTAELMVKSYGRVEQIIEAFTSHFCRGTLPVINPLNSGENLLAHLPRSVWKRIESMCELYESFGEVKATPFTFQDWLSAHPGDNNFFLLTRYAPAAGIGIREVRDTAYKTLSELTGNQKRAFDIYFMPCHGFEEGKPFGILYASLAKWVGLESSRAKARLSASLRERGQLGD